MKKLTLLLTLAAALGVGISAKAQILVGASGTATLTFDSAPTLPATEWATSGGIGSSATTYGSAAAVDTAVQAVSQSSVNTALPRITANGTSVNARHNTAGTYLVTQATTAGATLLKATLRNDAGQALSHFTIQYDFGVAVTPGTEEAPGHEVFFSTNGLVNSWVKIPEFSGLNSAQSVSATIFVGALLPGQDIYLLWADDNGNSNPDGGYTIDNFRVSSVVTTNAVVALSATLTSPANDTYYTSSSLNPANVQMTATSIGSTPPTSVTFYVDDAVSFVDSTAPYSNTVALAIGTHTIYAKAVNASETAYTVTNTIVVRDEFVHFNGGLFEEGFDGMGTVAGSRTPAGWYVGSNLTQIIYSSVMTNDGGTRPQGGIAGYNIGSAASVNGEADRALGTQPTSTDRSIVVRIKNDTSFSITAVDFTYRGESWRKYTNGQFGYTNQVSVDQGATWLATGFNFLQPTPADPTVAPAAIDGNADGNHTDNVGGVFALPSPVPPNGVVYIRWWDVNEAADDGTVAIDDFVFNAQLDVFTPTLVITSPTNGNSFAYLAPITITAVPSMANPVTNVTFYDNNFATVIGTDTTSPFSISVNTLSVGSHTLYAVAQDNGGARATNTANVTITINPNQLPSITFTNPVTITDYLVGTMVTNISVSASDSDGSIARVEFYNNDLLWATDTNSPYGFDLCDIYAGVHVISAVAVDNAGGRTTNSISITATNPPGITAIVTNGSSWKYLDNGTDQGTAWQAFAFDDSLWASGFGELGYGDAGSGGRPERTTVSFGPNANSKYITTYFRRKINVASPGAFSALQLSVLRDDAAVVYFNGTEVFRTGSLTNELGVVPITYTTLTTNAASDDGTVYFSTNLSTSLLSAGDNIIAVEVHQDSITSSDISFDLMLWGTGTSQPRITVTRPNETQITIAWGADAAGYTLYGGPSVPFSTPAWTAIGSPITGAGSTTISSSTGIQFFILRNP
jgi:hypothetical protein